MASNGLPPLFYWQGREEGGAESAPTSLEGGTSESSAAALQGSGVLPHIPRYLGPEELSCHTPSMLTVDVTGPVHLY